MCEPAGEVLSLGWMQYSLDGVDSMGDAFIIHHGLKHGDDSACVSNPTFNLNITPAITNPINP